MSIFKITALKIEWWGFITFELYTLKITFLKIDTVSHMHKHDHSHDEDGPHCAWHKLKAESNKRMMGLNNYMQAKQRQIKSGSTRDIVSLRQLSEFFDSKTFA